MRYRSLAVALCSLGLLAGCGLGGASMLPLAGKPAPSQQVAAMVAYAPVGKDDAQRRAIADRVDMLRLAVLDALRARPVKAGTLHIAASALEAFDSLAAKFRIATDPAERIRIAESADLLTQRALQDLRQAGDPWGDPDAALRQRLETLRREYERGTFGWKEYNEARVAAILKAYGASAALRLDELEEVYRDGGLDWQTYNKHRKEILATSYGTPLATRLELLERIYRDGGMPFREYNETRVRLIMTAYGEPIDDRLAYLEDVYRDGGLDWRSYNQARLDLIAKAYDQRLAKRLDLLETVYREGGMTFNAYNETRVSMIMDARHEPLQTRLDLLEKVYDEGGLTWAAYQQYRKQLLAEG